MIEKYFYEFSKIYIRLLRLEVKIKGSAISALTQYYKENTLKEYLRFFHNKDRRKRYSYKGKCRFDNILLDHKLDSTGKFVALVDLLTLSDLLMLTLKTEQFRKPEIISTYYSVVPENIYDLEKHLFDLVHLRNSIAHFKFQMYEENKTQYLDTLYTFEYYLGHNIKGITKLPKFERKPKTAEIIRAIYELRPDLIHIVQEEESELEVSYYNQDRMLLSLFDDIALYNGYEAQSLPSPWSVLRQVFNLKKEIKESQLN